MTQKKEISRINAIAQIIMVKIFDGEKVDVENGDDAEVRQMIVKVVDCRMRKRT